MDAEDKLEEGRELEDAMTMVRSADIVDAVDFFRSGVIQGSNAEMFILNVAKTHPHFFIKQARTMGMPFVTHEFDDLIRDGKASKAVLQCSIRYAISIKQAHGIIDACIKSLRRY